MKAFNLICFSMAISGCAATFNGTPDPVIDIDKTVERYSIELEKLANQPPKKCEDLKSGINQTLTALDLRYAEFVNDISLEGRTKTTATDFALIGLGLAGTAVGGAEAKTILHAISTGVAGANTSIDKNYFYEKTIPALISQMNADRKQRQLLIIERLQNCDNRGYSWFEAVHDLTDYYAAGTLLGAISSISKDAGVKQTDFEAKINKKLMNAVTYTLGQDTPTKKRLDEVLFKPDGKGEKEIMDCLNGIDPTLLKKSGCMKEGDELDAATFISAKECAEAQTEVLACIEKKRGKT
ncbi:MAG: hypothetical protein WAW41_00280 [Methylobacter sp.]